MVKLKKSIALLCVCAMLSVLAISPACAINIKADELEISQADGTGLLFITRDVASTHELSDAVGTAVMDYASVTAQDLETARGIALPAEYANTFNLENAYSNNKRIYLYSENLSVSEYNHSVGTDYFGKEVPVDNDAIDYIADEQTAQIFGGDSNERHQQFIGFVEPMHTGDDISTLEYYNSIVANYNQQILKPTTRATIADSSIGVTLSKGLCSLTYGWILERASDTDTSNDYFGIRCNVNPYVTGGSQVQKFNKVSVTMETGDKTNQKIYQSAPESTEFTGSISRQIAFPVKNGGSMTITSNVSTGTKVTRTSNLANGKVSWVYTSSLNGNEMESGYTFSKKVVSGSKQVAKTNIILEANASGWSETTTIGPKTIAVNYSYAK